MVGQTNRWAYLHRERKLLGTALQFVLESAHEYWHSMVLNCDVVLGLHHQSTNLLMVPCQPCRHVAHSVFSLVKCLLQIRTTFERLHLCSASQATVAFVACPQIVDMAVAGLAVQAFHMINSVMDINWASRLTMDLVERPDVAVRDNS